jgi:hypothetical protein
VAAPPAWRSKLDLACELVGLLCDRYPDRQLHLICDAAYAGKTLPGLPAQVNVTTRLRADAALYQLPPPRRPGQRGRPRVKGERLPELIVLAALVAIRWQQAIVVCYGQPRTVELTSLVCLWHTVFGAQPVRVVLVREPGAPDGYELALVSTDPDASPAALVQRYATRWSIEVCFEESRQVAGVGQARNRTAKAVERTVPFGLLCMTLVVCWYATHGQPPVMSPTAAPARPGTGTSARSRSPTCSPRCGAPSSPLNIHQVACLPPPQQKSSKSRQPGPPPQHEVRNPSEQASRQEVPQAVPDLGAVSGSHRQALRPDR